MAGKHACTERQVTIIHSRISANRMGDDWRFVIDAVPDDTSDWQAWQQSAILLASRPTAVVEFDAIVQKLSIPMIRDTKPSKKYQGELCNGTACGRRRISYCRDNRLQNGCAEHVILRAAFDEKHMTEWLIEWH